MKNSNKITVTIKIECDDLTDVLQHLNEIKKKIKKHYKSVGEVDTTLSDNNCFGVHEAVVKFN